MNDKVSLIFLLFFFFSCELAKNEDEGQVKHYHATQEEFSKLVNSKNIPINPDLGADIFMENSDYPIELSLYKNGKWYYDLPNLGSGNGTWEYVNGKIKLYAKRTLFDMHINIISLDEEKKNFGITFNDRFGPRFLKMQVLNL